MRGSSFIVKRKAYERGEVVGPVLLVEVCGHLLEWQTAVCYVRMAAAAKRDGIDLRLNSGFREMQEQRALYVARMDQPGDDATTRARKSRIRSSRGIAARPGYSRHQNGTAIDVATGMTAIDHRQKRFSKRYLWLRENAARYGFAVDTVPNEPWHLERVITLERWRA